MGAADLVRLVSQATCIRETLARSVHTSNEMIEILASVDFRLTALETTMRPIQMTTQSFRQAHLNIEATLKAAEKILAHFNTPRQVEICVREGAQKEIQTYLSALDRLDEALKSFHSHFGIKGSQPSLEHALQLRREAVAGLEAAFIRELTEEWDVRMVAVEAALQSVGARPITGEEAVSLPWETLEGMIGNWISHMQSAVYVIYPMERQLCDSVFADLDPHRERIYAELACADNGFQALLDFGDVIAASPRLPMKLFVILDMYNMLRELMGQIEVTFSGPACIPARESARLLMTRLAETARSTFVDFEDAVDGDIHMGPVTDGAVHALTTYVVNYIKFLMDYEVTLSELFSDKAGASHLGSTAVKIMGVLVANLESKAKVCKDPALHQLFLMNNVHFMMRSMRRSTVFRSEAALRLLGKDWIDRHRLTVQLHASAYQRAAWAKVLGYLSAQGIGGDLGSLGKTAIKDRFKNFNAALEEIHARQSMWIIPDSGLREAVLLAVAEVLLPAYTSFLTKCSVMLEVKTAQKHVKYSTDQVDKILQDLFTGKNVGLAR